jgi:7-carboxy-7-deazaguanine synthase
MLTLVEKYITISGEAPIPGRPVYLIRLSGCNMDCSYCDTPYKEERNLRFSARELIVDIADQTARYAQLSVLFTGGEPLLDEHRESVMAVVGAVPETQFYIETNGTVLLPSAVSPNCHFVMDWKAPSSGAARPFRRDNLRRLKPDRDCIKLVVSKEDLPWAKKTVTRINEALPGLPVYLSPVWGSLDPADLAAFIIENRLPAALSVQLHKLVWPDRQRGV